MRSLMGNLAAENGSTRATTNTFDKGLFYRSMIPESDVTTAVLTGVDTDGNAIDFEAKYGLTEMKAGQLYSVASNEIILSIETDGVVICY